MSIYTENLIKSLREHLIDKISNIFEKHGKKDNLGCTSIQALGICDESIYLVINDEPEYNSNVLYLGELEKLWDVLGGICVQTFEYGSTHITELPTETLIKCYEYLSVLENKKQ